MWTGAVGGPAASLPAPRAWAPACGARNRKTAEERRERPLQGTQQQSRRTGCPVLSPPSRADRVPHRGRLVRSEPREALPSAGVREHQACVHRGRGLGLLNERVTRR